MSVLLTNAAAEQGAAEQGAETPRSPPLVLSEQGAEAPGSPEQGADAPRSPPLPEPRADLLDGDQIVKTIDRLESRIAERFPDSGLRRVCARLHVVGLAAEQRSREIARPILWLRAAVWTLVAVVAVSLAATAALVVRPPIAALPVRAFEPDADAARRPPPVDDGESMSFVDFVQVLEAGINDVVLIGAALIFLVTLETRAKRGRALSSIHELRAMAHIIDMHQLTKDPERVLHPELLLLEPDGSRTPKLDAFELCRYLDYCSEMLSLIGKLAALYVQRFDDGPSLAAVNEIENLCTGLSRKIWQKIMIVEAANPPRAKESKNEA